MKHIFINLKANVNFILLFQFIAHPNVQQLLSTLWYDGLPGFRRLNPIQQLWEIVKIGVFFPFYSIWYMMFPNSGTGRLVKKPF